MRSSGEAQKVSFDHGRISRTTIPAKFIRPREASS
jgi:hypothetical protein